MISDLYKTEVFELADYLDIDKEITTKEPTAELFKGQTDKLELGADYGLLDGILKDYVDKKKTKSYLNKKYDKKVVDKVMKRIVANKHKTKFPEVIKKK